MKVRLLSVVMLAALQGCGSNDDGEAKANGVPPWDHTQAPLCGLAPHEWRPATEVGGVLEQSIAQERELAEIQSLAGVLKANAILSHPLVHGARIYTLRYQTQDKGQLVDATAMVAVPFDPAPAPAKYPIVAYLHGTTGFDDGCAPSVDAADRYKPNTAIALLYAGLGYVAVLPDYIGMKSLGDPSPDPLPYLVAEPTAIAALDAIRAAKKLVAAEAPSIELGDVVIAGHSQGGHAAEVTARFAPYYAPELRIAGGVYVAATADLAAGFDAALAGEVTAARVRLGIAWAYANSVWYGSGSMSDVLVSPWDSQVESIVKGTCASGYTSPLEGVTEVSQVLKQPLLDAIAAGGSGFDPWSCFMRENSPTTMAPPIDAVPALYVLGQNDLLVLPEPQRKAFQSLCEQGQKLVFLECAGADHGRALTFSFDDQLDFFDARLAKQPLPESTCQLAAATTCKSTPP